MLKPQVNGNLQQWQMRLIRKWRKQPRNELWVTKNKKKLFLEYFQGKQTLKQLSIKYHKSIPWIKKYLDEYLPEEIKISPSKNQIHLSKRSHCTSDY